MKRKTIDDLGPLQKKIMEFIWELGEATVNDIRERIDPRKDMAYTTFLSAMQKLEKEGWLEHRSEGRNYTYSPTLTREEEGSRSLQQFIKRIFNGDPLLLFQHLIKDAELNESDLAKIKKMIDQRKKELGHE